MYAGEPQLGAEEQKYPLDGISRISPAEGMWLYRLCREEKPRNTLEIGLGYGFSTIYFLAALQTNAAGHHTAVDPFQLRASSKWRGVGLQHARHLGVESLFTFLEERSLPALVSFAKQGRQFEVTFIDGGHHFDEALIDFTLGAALCPEGGHIVLDDTWMPAIRRVTAFIETNRPDFAAVASPVENIAVFRRTGSDTREWAHFVEFARR
jgi:predicted O-methyltransferase YrrM